MLFSACHPSNLETLLEFDAESFLGLSFPTDLVEDNEGLTITKDSLHNQIGPEPGRELNQVHVEALLQYRLSIVLISDWRS